MDEKNKKEVAELSATSELVDVSEFLQEDSIEESVAEENTYENDLVDVSEFMDQDPKKEEAQSFQESESGLIQSELETPSIEFEPISYDKEELDLESIRLGLTDDIMDQDEMAFKMDSLKEKRYNYEVETNKKISDAANKFNLPDEILHRFDYINQSIPTPSKNASYLFGGLSEFNKGIADLFRTVDGAIDFVKTGLAGGMNVIESLAGKPEERQTKVDHSERSLWSDMADVMESIGDNGNPASPDNVIGDVIGGTARMIPDIITTVVAPELKIRQLGVITKGLVNTIPKFPALLGVKSGINDWSETLDTGEAAKGFGHGYIEGLTFEGLGLIGKEMGMVAKELGSSGAVSEMTAAITNGTLFGGHSVISDPDVYNDGEIDWDLARRRFGGGFGMGIAFHAKDVYKELNLSAIAESMNKKSYVEFMSSNQEAITSAVNNPKSQKELRKLSVEYWKKARSSSNQVEANQLYMAKNAIDNVIMRKYMAEKISKNPDSFLSEIKDNKAELNSFEKDFYTDKINQTVKSVDAKNKLNKDTKTNTSSDSESSKSVENKSTKVNVENNQTKIKQDSEKTSKDIEKDLSDEIGNLIDSRIDGSKKQEETSKIDKAFDEIFGDSKKESDSDIVGRIESRSIDKNGVSLTSKEKKAAKMIDIVDKENIRLTEKHTRENVEYRNPDKFITTRLLDKLIPKDSKLSVARSKLKKDISRIIEPVTERLTNSNKYMYKVVRGVNDKGGIFTPKHDFLHSKESEQRIIDRRGEVAMEEVSKLTRDMNKEGIDSKEFEEFMYAQNALGHSGIIEKTKNAKSFENIELGEFKGRNKALAEKRRAEINDELIKLKSELSKIKDKARNGKTKKTRDDSAIKAVEKAKEVSDKFEELNNIYDIDGFSGMKTVVAKDIMERHISSGKAEKMAKFAERFRKETSLTDVEDLYLSGMMSAEKYESMTENPFYIPSDVKMEVLIADGQKTKPAMVGRLKRKKESSGVRSDEIKRQYGSRKYDYKQRVSPMSQAIINAAKRKRKIESNSSLQKFAKWAENPRNKKILEAEGITISVEGQQLGRDFHMFERSDGTSVVRSNKTEEIARDRIPFFQEGKVKFIRTDNPKIIDMFTKFSSTPEMVTKALTLSHDLQRLVHIKMKLAFSPTMAIRDVGDAILKGSAYGKGFGTKVALDAPKMLNELRKAAMSGVDTQLIKGYKDDGGYIRRIDIRSVEQVMSDIETMAKDLNAGKSLDPLKMARRTSLLMDSYNSVFENAVRISAYKEALARGFDRTSAINASRNITTNFSRKGRWSTQMGAFWLFFAAATSGMSGAGMFLKDKNVRRSAGYAIAGAAALEMYNRMMVDDWDLKVRNDRNYGYMPIANPFSNRHFKIPMPYNLAPISTMGRSMVDIYETGDVGRNISDIAGSILGATNPFGSADLPIAITPTTLRTPMKLMTNRNHFGGTLVPEDMFYSQGKKDSSKHDYQSSNASVDFANWVNNSSGGDNVRAGAFDFSPNSMETVMRDYGGTFWHAASGSYDMFAYPEDADFTGIPVIGEFANYFSLKEGSSVSEAYEIAHKSYANDLTKQEEKRFNRILKASFNSGDLELEQAKSLIKIMKNNKNRKSIGDAVPSISDKDVETILHEIF